HHKTGRYDCYTTREDPPWRMKTHNGPPTTACDIPIKKRSEKPLSPLSKGSGAPGGGRNTPKKKAAMGCDLKLLLGKTSGVKISQRRHFRNKSRGTSNSSLACYNVSIHFVAQVVSYLQMRLHHTINRCSKQVDWYKGPTDGANAADPLDIRASPSALRRLAALYFREETGCSLPLEKTGCSLPSEKTCWSLPSEETDCSLPPKETGCSLPSGETGCSLPPEETLHLSYFLWT
nr:hypothetical protein [Tanacetum cinerariifolium]